MPTTQGVLLGYRWFLEEPDFTRAHFRYQHRKPLLVYVPEKGLPVLAVNDGELRYNHDTHTLELTRPMPGVPLGGFEHWEYQGIEVVPALTKTPKGYFQRCKAGDVLGFTRPVGFFSLGFYKTIKKEATLEPSREHPIDYLRLVGASYASYDLGESSGAVKGLAALGVLYVILKALS